MAAASWNAVGHAERVKADGEFIDDPLWLGEDWSPSCQPVLIGRRTCSRDKLGHFTTNQLSWNEVSWGKMRCWIWNRLYGVNAVYCSIDEYMVWHVKYSVWVCPCTSSSRIDSAPSLFDRYVFTPAIIYLSPLICILHQKFCSSFRLSFYRW